MISSLSKPGFAVLALLALLGCASTQTRNAVPLHEVERATPPGYAHIRFWGDVLPDPSEASATLMAAHRAAEYRRRGHAPRKLDFLAISGGAADGAFGAGLLTGWSSRGTRPEFDIVTGVSTGALIGAFAFLGPGRDAELTAAYTQFGGDHIARPRNFLIALLQGTSLADDSPLERLISRLIDETYLDEVAREHARGRRFFVATTNLDAQRPVIWDMGAIASSGQRDRLQLYRTILLASASVPGVFPPKKIRVMADNQIYDELHVDGAVTENAFVFPALFMEASTTLGQHVPRTLYIIQNGKLTPEWSETQPDLLPVIERSILTLAKARGADDLIRLYALARGHGMRFRLASIPADFTMKSPIGFDVHYMQAVYRRGYQLGRSQKEWRKTPPVLGLFP